MKTSNILSLALLLLVLMASLLVTLSFRKRITEGRFERVASMNYVRQPLVLSEGINTLMIGSSSTQGLRCRLHILEAEKAYYRYERLEDSIAVHISGDTLYVNYKGSQHKNGNWQYGIREVDLYLPPINELVVERAILWIDSLGTPASVKLLRDGTLHLAEIGQKTSARQQAKDAAKPMVDSLLSGDFPKLKVTSDGGRFTIGSYAWIGDLELHTINESRLEIAKGARIDRLSGSLSDSTSIYVALKDVADWTALLPGK